MTTINKIYDERKNHVFEYRMTAPCVLLLLLLTVYPFFFTLLYSFTNFNYLKHGFKLIAFKNYFTILQNEYFLQSLGNTVRFTVLSVILEVSIGVLLAVFVKSFGKKTQKVLRTLLMFPYLLPAVTVALVFKMMLSPNFGIFNHMLGALHIPVLNWFYDRRTAFAFILMIDAWQNVPFVFLLIYARLETISASQYEAARIDGASSFQCFLYITLPNLSNSLAVCIMLRVIDSFRLFEKVNILTGGGPAGSTSTITQFVYNYGIQTLKFGFGSACSVIMTVIVLLLSTAYLKKSLAAK